MSESSKEVEVRDEQGNLTGRFQLADGQLQGKATLYSAGRVLAEVGYADGLRHGEMRIYGDDGQPSSIVAHAAGLPHGEAMYFYPDGTLARRAAYKDGRLHGEVRDFAPDGKQISCTTYVEGRKQEAVANGPATAPSVGAPSERRKSWLARMVEG